MADTPDTILLARLQGTGDNVNLWGGYLNTALQTITRASKGYQALAVTGDATISWSNYSASNDGSVANLKLTGALTAAATLTFPNYMQNVNVWNGTTGGFAVTIKCSGQTGVSIPNGRKVALFCDGTDFRGATPGYIPDSITLTNSGDIVTKTTLETAIATASLPATSGTVLNSAADTTAGYLNSKVSVSGALSKSTTNSGANEELTLAVGALALTDGGRKTASFNASAATRYQVAWAADGTVTLPASPTQGDVIGLAVFASAYNTTINPNGKKINGSTSNLVMGAINETFTLTYDATLGDWA